MAEWEDVAAIIKRAFDEIEINFNDPTNEIGQKYLAKMMAKKALEKAMGDLAMIKNETIKQDIIYK